MKAGVALFLVAGTVSFFAPAVRYEFLPYDDNHHVAGNPLVRSLTPANLLRIFTQRSLSSYYPVRTLSFALEYRVWGLDARGYHLGNVLIHAANVLLVFLAGLRLANARRGGAGGPAWCPIAGAAAGAALFAVHPVVVEPVAWISGREELLTVLFGLLAFHLHVGENRHSWQRRALVLLFCVLACLSNVLGAVVPLLLLSYEVCVGPRDEGPVWRRVGRAAAAGWPLLIVSAVAVAGKIVADRLPTPEGEVVATSPVPFLQRPLVVLDTYWQNIRTLVWPGSLVCIYPNRVPARLFDWGVFLGAVSVAATLFGLWQARRLPVRLFGLLWFLIALAPGAQLLPHHVFRADRFLYLPLIGLAWGLGAELARACAARRGRGVALAAAALVPLALAVRSAVQLPVWHDGVRLFSRALRGNPDSLVVRNNLGNALNDKNRHEEALPHFSVVLRLDPYLAEGHFNMANALRALRRTEDALRHYEMALAARPRDPEIRGNMAVALSMVGKWEEAAAHFRDVLRVRPDDPMVHLNLGGVLGMQRRFDDAIGEFSEALRLDPRLTEAHLNLGVAFTKQGRLDEAVAHFSAALRIRPDHGPARAYLARVLKQKAEARAAGGQR
ncbi:MAG: tetratricopeptide repeat protein [Kiritimatiellae bacterium]|nr:tetratricopeptide repeat protein [Kiritimatiellia bacterium]